ETRCVSASMSGEMLFEAEPEPPTFPSVIGTLHITTRTGTAPNDKTDDNPLYLCLTATDCWRLDELEYDNFELGAIETFMIEDVNLPRSAVDRVELRSTNGADAWRAACVQVVFDGDPVYCSEPDVFMGAGQTLTWTDPLGLHNACTSCFSSALTHGPILGPPSPDGPRIWFRADARRRTEVVIAPTHEGLDSAAPIAVRYPDYARDLTDVVQVDGLTPDTTWHYRVDVDGLGSYDGTFRTAPADGAATRFKLAFGSTAELASQPVFTGIAAAGPDMFLFAGDNHFGHTKLLPDQREYYRAAHRIGPRAALTANVPTVAIWNDDDYAAVGGGVSSPGKADVLRAFTEYWPNLYFGTDDTDGVFSKVSYGDIDLFLLDGRYWRDATSLLGAAQLAWLEGELLASNATFKLVALGTQWSHEATDDGWAGYPVAWEDFTGFLADEAIDGVVLLSGGGGHREVRVTHAAQGGYGVPEVVSSALASAATACPTSANETIACADGGDGFAMLDIDTTAADPTLTITLRDVAGAAVSTTVLHRSALESYDPPADPGVDINGDGYGDVVFGIPGENNGAGAIGVVFGSPGGADSWGDAWWSQASPDVPGDEETNDNFGAALAVGDFDADGFDDIAVGIPLEDIGTIEHGYAEVLYGGPTGIVSARTQDWRQAYNGIGDAVEAGDRLGAALAAGDFNGDGYDELVIGVPGESNGGQIQILFGSAAGLTSVGNQTWYQSINGTGSADEAGDRFGATLEVGDFDADGYEDLAIGAPDEGVGALASAGAVTIMYGSATGIVNTRSLAFNGNSVPGVAEASDKLGQALAAGDLNGDGYDDLLVGVPFEDLTTTNCGAFLYLAGSASGVTTASAVLLSYDLPAFGHPAAANDQLGAALAIADIDGDGYADAVIGAPGRAVSGFASAGELLVMYGSASGPSTSRFRFMSQLDTTNAGPEANDQFAATLSAADLDGDGYADVIIGAPGEAIGAITSAGLFHTMYGSAAGLLSGGQRWHQDVALIEETVETSDRVGAALP
ncbi:MAG TPA: FG-GAP-like repeat-containing protein, partial [Myxococcota bacterium]|nr:FG-GAP-like repeat-containing protein [Myxococcota bacterium]